MIDYLLIIVIVCLAPIIVYQCVKLGTVAFYRGRDFHKKQKGDRRDGHQEDEE